MLLVMFCGAGALAGTYVKEGLRGAVGESGAGRVGGTMRLLEEKSLEESSVAGDSSSVTAPVGAVVSAVGWTGVSEGVKGSSSSSMKLLLVDENGKIYSSKRKS